MQRTIYSPVQVTADIEQRIGLHHEEGKRDYWEDSTNKARDITTISVSSDFSVAVIKCSDKRNLREKVTIWAYHSRKDTLQHDSEGKVAKAGGWPVIWHQQSERKVWGGSVARLYINYQSQHPVIYFFHWGFIPYRFLNLPKQHLQLRQNVKNMNLWGIFHIRQ